MICEKHQVSMLEVCEGDYGSRIICVPCCEEQLRLSRKQQEYDFYGTEPLWDDVMEDDDVELG